MTNNNNNQSQRFIAETHQVKNQPKPLQDYNTFEQDIALTEQVSQYDASWANQDLSQFGKLTGNADVIELGFMANEQKPVLYTHDRYGHRIDEVRFHPAYHQLMAMSMEHGLHSSHWQQPKAGAQVARAAKFYLQTQVEAAHGCPITMTSAAVPALLNQPDLADAMLPKILSNVYDSSNRPLEQKHSITIGMAMTEKQGGSDVRTNETVAHPVGQSGSGQAYELVGHKYFVSAPMSDAFLVLAQTPAGISCFFVPRWRPDGTKNPIQLQRLKNKMGNVANASSETELRGAYGIMVGEEGRGIATILEMVSMTRIDCMIGSSSGMRQAVAQATHHCHTRVAFGQSLAQQPLMQNVLTDLIIEHEAALAMTMRTAHALDCGKDNELQRQFMRLATAVGKYWICKRTPGHAYEAMECLGGGGVMEDCIMPRLLRESPVNSIWEGSGNVQCLDMLRALNKDPSVLDAYFAELNLSKGGDKRLDAYIVRLKNEFTNRDNIEYRARSIVEKLALALQGSLLVRHGNHSVSDAFSASRLSTEQSGHVYGNLPTGIDCSAIVERATPILS